MHATRRGPRSTALGPLSLIATLALMLTSGCDDRNVAADSTYRFDQHIENQLDVLLVIDSSYSMEQEQQTLRDGLTKLVESLLTPQFGGGLPDLYLGVVSTDLGAGSYPDVPSCSVQGGDGGKLLYESQVSGCHGPQSPWIMAIEDATNIPNCAPGDSVQCVIETLGCIARLGTHGCDYSMPLEAAKRALDPKLKLNPGFPRPNALLAVVFITDEDDCSAAKTELLDPRQQGLSDPLGPLTPFRCFEFGVRCDVNDRNTAGERKGCAPAYDWLHTLERYETFFRSLKKHEDRVHLVAIAGPTSPVVVGKNSDGPTLEPSCKSASAVATPALRLGKLVEAFGGEVLPICDPKSFSEALAPVAARLRSERPPQCLPKPLALPGGGVACHQGVDVCKMPSCSGGATCNEKLGVCERAGTSTGDLCGETCLDKVSCSVTHITKRGEGEQDWRHPVRRCLAKNFRGPGLASYDCGSDCPCWRVVPDARCKPADGVSPFAIEILNIGGSRSGYPGLSVEVTCEEADVPWSAPEVQNAAAHCTAAPAPSP